MNPLFPTLTCGVFVFSSVSAFLLLRLPSLTHSTHSLTHSFTHSLTHSLTHSCTHSLTHTHTQLTLTHSLNSLTLTHSLSLTHSPLLRRRRGTMCTAKGSDVRPGVPWAPPLLRGRHTHSLTHSHSLTHLFCVAGVGQCALPRGRMYALASLGLRLFCVAGVGQCALPRGRMYALASLGLRLFCVAGVGQCALPRGRM